MDPFEYAMQLELDGRKYYLEQAAKMSEPSLKRIFTELADDEQRHYQVFKLMSEGRFDDYEESFKSNVLPALKSIFREMTETNEEISDFPKGVQAVWEKARDIEDDAEKFYREQAIKAENDKLREIWSNIADEEHKHWVALDNVVNFISRPNQWLADAEWSNIEE